MTQDEIIRMAREAISDTINQHDQMLKRLWCIAYEEGQKAEREALTKSHEAAFQSYVDQAKADRELESLAARLDEREACAKVCDEYADDVETYHWDEGQAQFGRSCAAAIRARSQDE